MAFKIAAERCENCLFGRDRIVDGKRMKQVLDECRRRDAHFICHKFAVGSFGEDDELVEIDGVDVCCRGFYDTQPPTQLIRIAERVNCIEFVPLPDDGPILKPARLQKRRRG